MGDLHDPARPRYCLVAGLPTSGDPGAVAGRTYADLIAAHPFHPESKGLG